MLSRVAENLYWMARYLERAEDTARLINATTHLIIDLPRSVPLSWNSLIDILGCRAAFDREEETLNEKTVMRFLIAATTHGSSIATCIRQARENARASRDLLPADVWEGINRLALEIPDAGADAVVRHRRYAVLQHVILGCQHIDGVLHGNMSRGTSYRFISLGRNVERADMSTRILDVRAASLVSTDHQNLHPYAGVGWMSVLKSLGAYEMYRRDVNPRIRRDDVLNFLLKGRTFPRSIRYCLDQIHGHLQCLPNQATCLVRLDTASRQLEDARFRDCDARQIHEFLDGLQLMLGELDGAITETYFRFEVKQ